jgi:S1/P1 Nuclease
MTVALIAENYLTPSVRMMIAAMLSADGDNLTGHDLAGEATWADRFRSGDQRRFQRTRGWHFTEMAVAKPDMNTACFGGPLLPAGALASDGPADACSVDKVNQFREELAAPGTDPAERLFALKFLLHLVGDVHQPLHDADDHDRGGNDKRVSAPGFKAGNLHHYWDTEFVDQLGPDASTIASALIRRITTDQVMQWQAGKIVDWAQESFQIAKDDAYGRLPKPNARGGYQLTDDYVATATDDVSQLLSKAGVRLAFILNEALGRQ